KLPGTPDGSTYRYFYYDALYKGMLPADPLRDASIAARQEERARTEGEKAVELLRGRRMDSVLYFEDFWTTTTVKWFNTVWSHLLASRVTTPRLAFPDVGGRFPVLHPPGERERSRQVVRDFVETLRGKVFGSQPLPPPG